MGKNKTLESIFKDIDVLGINGGYSVEQLLSPQDCRMLKSTIKDLQERIDKAIEYIEKHKETREHYEPYGTPMGNSNYTTTHIFGYYELLNILQGSDKE